MPSLPPEGAAVSPLLTAALVLLAIPHLDALGLPHPTATTVIAATGASRSRAYELRAALDTVLPTLLRAPGRPAAPPSGPIDPSPILRAVRDFVFDHPGSVCSAQARRRYSDDFRRFVLDLAARHRDVPLDAFADAVGVPLPTLKDWLAGGVERTKLPKNLADVPPRDPTEPQVETLLSLWEDWQGSFTAFCTHAQHDWRLPFGRTLIATILTAHGVRFAKRRSGRSPDEDALRGQFQTFFPGAQWVGDGSPIDFVVDGQPFTFNVELMVDPCSGAVTGASVRDTEDGAAVVEAFDDGVATTGQPPLSVLLDNKPSNHADAVKEALGEGIDVVRATPYRPQNKAHVEGAFGLFRQVAPALTIALGPRREVARKLLELVVTLWARTLNHRPRKDRGGRSRVELYLDHPPTPEEIAAAKEALAERLRRQQRARQTRAARQDPQVRAALAEAFARFGFLDPDGHLLTAVAGYPLEVVVEAIAISEGRRRAGTFPEGADARYLLGIAHRLADEREGYEIALALWEERQRARDRALDAVERERERIDELHDDTAARLAAYVDRALRTSRRLDRFFWLGAAADTVHAEDPSEHHALFRLAARRIHATHAAPHPDRLAATRFLAARILPIA